jgi:hypothetical protein
MQHPANKRKAGFEMYFYMQDMLFHRIIRMHSIRVPRIIEEPALPLSSDLAQSNPTALQLAAASCNAVPGGSFTSLREKTKRVPSHPATSEVPTLGK